MHRLSLIIIDSDRISRTAMEQAVAGKLSIAAVAADLHAVSGKIKQDAPTVVILEVSSLETGIAQIKEILHLSPRSAVIVTCAGKDPDWILGLMRAGAVEYLLRPLELQDLYTALQKVARAAAPQQTTDSSAQLGKIIAVYNPVGGVGTTTIAVNLAAALAADKNEVALVDFNLFSGDVATFLDVNPKYTLSSVTNNVNRLDADFLRASMTRHSSGIYVLSEPLEVEETMGITAEQIHMVLTFLKSAFSYVIIDTGGPLFGGNLVTFKDADHILFATVLTLPTLKNVRRYLAALENQGLARDVVKVVVNRYLPKADIKIGDAEKVLGTKVFATIPNEYSDVIDSINKGMPAVTLFPRSPVTEAITRLAGQLKN